MENIVILGAGFGGLRAAIRLGKRSKWLAKRGYRIILVDKNAYHTFTPILYEIAATSKETANYLDLKRVAAYPLSGLLSGYNISFRQAEVKNIDARKGTVEIEGGEEIPYSHLIFALGAQTNYFKIEGVEGRAFPLKDFTGALALRDAILEKIYSAKYGEEVNIVVCGAGSTGVELSAELQEWFAELNKEGVKCNTKTTLIDGAPQILGTLDKEVVRRAERRLKRLGVNILTRSLVEKLRGDKLTLKGDVRIRYDVLIWTGGVQANVLIKTLPFRQSPRGIEVDQTLRGKLVDKRAKVKRQIYIIGDSAMLKTRTVVPQLARPAISGGSVAAKNVMRDIEGKAKESFEPFNYPYVVPVGGKYAVVKLGPFVVSGLLGWILKGLIELNYLMSIMPFWSALKIWFTGLAIFMKNDRLG